MASKPEAQPINALPMPKYDYQPNLPMTHPDVPSLVERLNAERTVNLSWPDAALIAVQREHELALEAATQLSALEVENARLRAAMEKIDAIRNSIIGFQTVGWSDHIYPLVAALEDAGYSGKGYDAMRTEIRTMLAAEARAERAEEQLKAATWQGIETAPKDGTDILIGGDGQSTHEARWINVADDYALRARQHVWESGWYWAGYSEGGIGPITPTHWMPLPDLSALSPVDTKGDGENG